MTQTTEVKLELLPTHNSDQKVVVPIFFFAAQNAWLHYHKNQSEKRFSKDHLASLRSMTSMYIMNQGQSAQKPEAGIRDVGKFMMQGGLLIFTMIVLVTT